MLGLRSFQSGDQRLRYGDLAFFVSLRRPVVVRFVCNANGALRKAILLGVAKVSILCRANGEGLPTFRIGALTSAPSFTWANQLKRSP